MDMLVVLDGHVGIVLALYCGCNGFFFLTCETTVDLKKCCRIFLVTIFSHHVYRA